MPCHTATTKTSVTVTADDTVEHTLALTKKNQSSNAAVLDEAGKLIGLFSNKILLKNLIPISVAMSDGIQIDIKVPAAPGVAKRLNNVRMHAISEVMDRKPLTVNTDDPIWEAVSLLVKNGGPLCVVDSSGKFFGFITYRSLLEDLENMQTTDS